MPRADGVKCNADEVRFRASVWSEVAPLGQHYWVYEVKYAVVLPGTGDESAVLVTGVRLSWRSAYDVAYTTLFQAVKDAAC